MSLIDETLMCFKQWKELKMFSRKVTGVKEFYHFVELAHLCLYHVPVTILVVTILVLLFWSQSVLVIYYVYCLFCFIVLCVVSLS